VSDGSRGTAPARRTEPLHPAGIRSESSAAGTLSGGQHTRLLLARALIRQPDLLLLDEPSNHLDLEGKEELAETLKTFSGAVLLLSHDRTLIEQSWNRFWLVDRQRSEEWHTLAPVYAVLAGSPPPAEPFNSESGTDVIDKEETEEEQLLARLVELEQRLAEDIARKPKHQKPELQREWQSQIARLTALLSLD
jgi:ATPase subunit of ABC transporter with duplicated ATPase domains